MTKRVVYNAVNDNAPHTMVGNTKQAIKLTKYLNTGKQKGWVWG